MPALAIKADCVNLDSNSIIRLLDKWGNVKMTGSIRSFASRNIRLRDWEVDTTVFEYTYTPSTRITNSSPFHESIKYNFIWILILLWGDKALNDILNMPSAHTPKPPSMNRSP